MWSATVVKNLRSLLQLDPSTALMLAKKFKAANSHEEIDSALSFADGVLHGHGVEAIEGVYVDRYHQNINLLYVNRGDTYSTTIVFDTLKHRFYVGSWGDWVEAAERQGRMMR